MSPAPARPWRIRVDTGGTFTDCLAVAPNGAVRRAKVLSTGALRGAVRERLDARHLAVEQRWGACDDLAKGFSFAALGTEPVATVIAFDAEASVLAFDAPVLVEPGMRFEVRGAEEAPLLAARLVTATPAGRDLPPIEMRLATTRGTNALLERRGARCAFFVTRGFGDLLEIGDQRRPDIFALDIVKPRPLPEAVVEVAERLAADGSVLEPPDLGAVAAAGRRLVAGGITTAAVALLHSHVNPAHEELVGNVLSGVGFDHVTCSCHLAPLIKLLPRAETAVVEAYLAPVLRGYLDRVGAGLSGGVLHVLTSAGGLVRDTACRASRMLLSGPAGGVAGAAAAGRRSGFTRIIGFDMGGTSTDVARCDGAFEYRFEHRVGDARLAAPALDIETVASGGGSICDLDPRGLPRVGPGSAGASPGPACYGAGGPLTLTDVNLLLGRLDPDRFEIPIDVAAAEAALEAVAAASVPRPPRDEVLLGFLRIADERMAGAIAEVSVRRGHDPADHALVAFGGAGGQHACAVADLLGIRTVLLPADASLLSAAGLGAAVFERFSQRQVLRPLDEVAGVLGLWLDELAATATAEVRAEGVPAGAMARSRGLVSLRLLGQESSIQVDLVPDLAAVFARRYRDLYGHAPPDRPVEVESIRAVVSSSPAPEPPAPAGAAPHDAAARRRAVAHLGGRRQAVPIFEREELLPGAALRGPALVLEAHSAAVIESGWAGMMDGAGALVLRRDGRAAAPGSGSGSGGAAQESLFAHRFETIATRMGLLLERTALSTNVKERLDFSCALLNSAGRLLVNAPHIPVHLGALGACVRAVAGRVNLRDGDVAVTNHPAFGGSHLPDVTVITPVFHGATVLGYVASRAHHGEIGGTRPGSMPPSARTLAEEGVVIPPMHLVRGGRSCFGDVERLLAGGPWPSRAIAENLADLRAALAANRHGASALRALAAEHGAEVVAAQMALLEDRAERGARAALRRLEPGRREASVSLDDGSPIRVSIEIGDGAAIVDFTGSAPVHPGNLNATPAIVGSAVIYVLRLVAGAELPLNEGLLRAVRIIVPPGILDPCFGDDPARAPAVSGGNVETSQRLVEALLLALGVAAASQGTMNNVVIGNGRFSYYETIGGGAGATPEAPGADAVHTHMTNTRITDPEILEHRYPIRVERFERRRGSGGRGAHRGGDGIVRELRFLEPVSISLLTQHRESGPPGCAGGGAGLPGRQRLLRAAGGAASELRAVDGCEASPGDRLLVETPGGGAWGADPAPGPLSEA